MDALLLLVGILFVTYVLLVGFFLLLFAAGDEEGIARSEGFGSWGHSNSSGTLYAALIMPAVLMAAALALYILFGYLGQLTSVTGS